MSIFIGIVLFILMGALARSYPALTIIIIFGGLVLGYFVGFLEPLINEHEGWLVAVFIGFLLGVISRFIDPD
ncbi:hypothetical protein [Paenibacillus sp. PL91]|uniref:hypothetical protein n=1 Tax=Paenibacillus sp. PL91 TaxID=2729538 RepID=UPI00145D7802|nr:hypothetical protein [Paenibacillus sp. PL91]MBC9203698.1 hypothetical protein [Paenibacillus sp. PL91]